MYAHNSAETVLSAERVLAGWTTEVENLYGDMLLAVKVKETLHGLLNPSKGVKLTEARHGFQVIADVDLRSARARQTQATKAWLRACKGRDEAAKELEAARAAAALPPVTWAETVSAKAGRPISEFLEECADGAKVLWFWPTELSDDTDEQAKVAVGIQRMDSLPSIIDADRGILELADDFADAISIIAWRLRSPEVVAANTAALEAARFWPAAEAVVVPVVAEVVALDDVPATPKAKRARKALAPDPEPVVDAAKLVAEFTEDAATYLALIQEVAAVAATASADEINAFAPRIDALQTSLGGLSSSRLKLLAGVALPLSVEADMLAAQPVLAAVRETLWLRIGGNQTAHQCGFYASALLHSLIKWRETVPGATVRHRDMVADAYPVQAAWLGEAASAGTILDIANIDQASEMWLARLTQTSMGEVLQAEYGDHLRVDAVVLRSEWETALASGSDRSALRVRMAAMAKLAADSVPEDPKRGWAASSAVRLRRIAERWAAIDPEPDGGNVVEQTAAGAAAQTALAQAEADTNAKFAAMAAASAAMDELDPALIRSSDTAKLERVRARAATEAEMRAARKAYEKASAAWCVALNAFSEARAEALKNAKARAAELAPVAATASAPPAVPTEIQGLPVVNTLADVKRVCGDTRLIAGITGYCRYAGPLGQAWLASAPRAPGREPSGGFAVAA